MDDTLLASMAAVLSDAAARPSALQAALSRFPPDKELLLSQTHSAVAKESSPAALLNAAVKALAFNSGLAGEAAHPAEALAVFAPAVTLLRKALDALESANEGGDASSAAALQRLEALAARTIACMHTAAKGAECRDTRAVEEQSRWWLEWRQIPASAEPVPNAVEACRGVVAVRAAARLMGGSGAAGKGDAGVVPYAAQDMRLLAPYAAAGQLEASADADAEDVARDAAQAQVFVALYKAAARQGEPQNCFKTS